MWNSSMLSHNTFVWYRIYSTDCFFFFFFLFINKVCQKLSEVSKSTVTVGALFIYT